MIYRARTMTVSPQTTEAVRDVSVRAAAYVNGKYPEIHVEILENIAGPHHQIHMVTRCESLAALEAYDQRRLGDADWMALVGEVNAIQGITLVSDALYRVIAQKGA